MDKDDKGKFVKGNKAAKGGNPFQSQVVQLRSALMGAVTRTDIVAIAHKLRDQAVEGDVKSATLLLSYILGKPLQTVDANITTNALTPEQQKERLDQLLGIK